MDYVFFSCNHSLCKKREEMPFFGEVFRESGDYQFKVGSSQGMEMERGEVWELFAADENFLGPGT